MTFTRTGTVVGRSLFGYMFELTATETSSVAMFPPSLRTDEDVSTMHHAATKHGPSIPGKNGCARSHDCGSDDREEDDVLCSAAVGDFVPGRLAERPRPRYTESGGIRSAGSAARLIHNILVMPSIAKVVNTMSDKPSIVITVITVMMMIVLREHVTDSRPFTSRAGRCEGQEYDVDETADTSEGGGCADSRGGVITFSDHGIARVRRRLAF